MPGWEVKQSIAQNPCQVLADPVVYKFLINPPPWQSFKGGTRVEAE